MIFNYTKSIPNLGFVFNNIKTISEDYNNFHHWFWNKVALNENYNIITLMDKNEFVGSSIIKNTEREKKLCAIRLTEKFQKKGYGLYLIDESLKQLNMDKPLCSVSERNFHTFSRIFINRYKFNINFVHNGLYKKGVLEYQFNGELDSLKKDNGYSY